MDTGAARSLISKQLADNSKLKVKLNDIPILKGITGDKLNVSGRLENAEIILKKKKLIQDFLIVKHLKEEMILGQDFLTNHKVTLDFHKRTINLDGMASALCITDKDHKNWCIKSKENASISGVSIVECSVWQGTREREDLDGWFIIIPDQDLWGEQDDHDWQDHYEV